MTHLKEYWLIYFLWAVIFIVIVTGLPDNDNNKDNLYHPAVTQSIVPGIYELSNSEADNLIRYGKVLIDSTSKYFGPHGKIASITNGLDCQNCHRESGTKLFTNNFLTVASTYPKYRERSGRNESVEWRINECMQRSLNGEPIDSLSKEMKAMVAYIKWTGKNIKKNVKVTGAGSEELPFLERSANPLQGKLIYAAKCRSCHGENGEGKSFAGDVAYLYPPLWGTHSYAVSAGMYRISKLASFIKSNMPLGATYIDPQLSNEEAWDLAAFINTQPHPKKIFATDWPKISGKPVDHPYGPYSDNFSERQHKYGPFDPIKKEKDRMTKK